MKKIIVLMILLPGTLTVKSQGDSIYAIVSHDTVTLWHIYTHRNCGALYQMIIEQDNYHIKWIESDTGYMYKCMCHFDLSVTFGPLGPGTYSADVYHTENWEQDTVYDGSTTFIVEQSLVQGKINIIRSWESDCYFLTMVTENHESNPVGQNFPNPFSGWTTIPYRITDHLASDLLIMNVLGEVVRVFKLSPDVSQINWDGTDVKGKYLPSGIYYYGRSACGQESFRKMVIVR